MNKSKELVKNTVIIFLGKACTQLISFLLLPLYTAYLTKSDYGIVDLIITYVSLLVPVITVQLEMAAFRFLVDNRTNKEEISKIITNILYCMISFSILFTVVYCVLNKFISIQYNWYILFNILVTIFSNLMLQVSRGLGDNKTYSIGSFLAGATTVIFNVILIIMVKSGAKGMLISSIMANFVAFIYVFIKLKIYKYINDKLYNKSFIKKSLKYSWPLVPNSISWWIVSASDRTIISYILGVSANGIYAVSNKFSSIVSSLLNIFNLSWTESASLHIDDDDRDQFFSNAMNRILKIFLSFVLMIIAFMPLVFKILINEQYKEAYLYIPILMLSTIFNGAVIVYSGIYIAKKLTKQVAATSIMAAVLNIAINLIFIKFIGLYAAAISTMLSYLIMAIYRHYDLKKYVNIKYENGLIIRSIIIFTIVIVIYYINNMYINIIGILITIIYVFLFNKDVIKYLLNFIQQKFIMIKN